MKDPRAPMIPVAQALEIVLREAAPLQPERIPLREAMGRALAEDVLADADQPPFPKALMDGFAVRSGDLRDVPVELRLVEEIPAGHVPRRKIDRGETARIMTGAPIPDGADAVQVVERSEPAGEGNVRILEKVEAGANIAPQGSEIRVGQKVLEAGEPLTPARIGVLASVGRAQVSTHRLPRVSLAATGDELVEAERTPPAGKIRNSNGPALGARAKSLGAEVVDLGIVRDDPKALRDCLGRGLQGDLLLLSGGVSMGVHDLVEAALAEAGVEVFIRKIAIRPGKPAVFGRKGSCLVFGLPGNPVSSLVIFEVLAAVAIRKMLGWAKPEGDLVEAVLEEEVRQRAGRTSYLPGRLRFEGGSIFVQPIRSQGSADLLSHSRADALFIVPADRGKIAAGDRVQVLLLK
jgi:molybdenum cofactor synthesis domain-containing protein